MKKIFLTYAISFVLLSLFTYGAATNTKIFNKENAINTLVKEKSIIENATFLSPVQKKSYSDLIEQNKRGVNVGVIEDEELFYKFTVSNGLKEKSALNLIVPNLVLAPEKDFRSLTGLEYLKSPKEWSIVVNSLFDISDVDSWIRIEKKDKFLKENEKSKYFMSGLFNGIKYEMSLYDKKNNLKEGTTFNNLMKDGLTLFKQGIELTPFKTREVYKRLFVDSFHIAYLKSLDEEELGAYMGSTFSINSVAEYATLIDPKIFFIKIENGYSETYLAINSDSLEKIKGLEKFYNNKFFDKASEIELADYILDLNLKQAEVEAEQSKAELEQSNKNIDYAIVRNELAEDILNKIKSYNKNPNDKLLSEIKNQVRKLINLKNQIIELQQIAIDSSLKQEINNGIIMLNSFLAKLDKKFLP